MYTGAVGFEELPVVFNTLYVHDYTLRYLVKYSLKQW